MTKEQLNKITKKIIICIIIVEVLMFIAICICVFYDLYTGVFGYGTLICMGILVLFGIVIPWIISPLLEKTFKQHDIYDKSIEYVKRYISDNYCTEVIPIKDEFPHGQFITKELTKRARFFAQTTADDFVVITILFNNENECVFFSNLNIIYFTTYFKVKNKSILYDKNN